jgi:hypothetical protein
VIEWLEQYIKSLAAQPDEVSLEQREGEVTSIINIKLSDDDLHLLDGVHNRVTRALNQVALLAGAKDRVRYVVKVSD